MSPLDLAFDVPPYRLSGRVYGALLNHRAALDALGAAAQPPPYQAPPKAPVLYVKPRGPHAAGAPAPRSPTSSTATCRCCCCRRASA